MKTLSSLLAASALAAASLAATVVLAQPPAAAPAAVPAAANPLLSPNATYTTIPMEIAVNRPAAEVWARVGKFCDIGEWLQIGACTITAGPANDIGGVRSVGGEVMVGKTPLSYTYAQTPTYQARGAGANRAYNMYHGTLEARVVTPTTSKLVYTLVYDNSMVTTDKATEMQGRRTTFERALNNMKILAEGGTLPPAAARGAAPAAAAPAPGR